MLVKNSGMRTIRLCGETLPHAGHVCAFFDSREQKYGTLIPFLQDAIDAGDEVVNIVDAADMDVHVKTLVEGGIPVHAAMSSGQLNIKSSEATYLQSGEQVLPRLLDFLRNTLRRVKAENRYLRTWGEMDWVGRGLVPIEEVLEYESRVNEFFPDFECTLLCVYDLAHTSPSLMTDILATHPSAILRGRLRKNPHYVDPSDYMPLLEARRRHERRSS